MGTHQDLLATDLRYLIHPLHNRAWHESSGRVWAKGEGAILTDVDGREYIDGLSGLWNVVAGHGRRELVDASTRQMETLAYVSSYAGGSTRPAIELAERLAQIVYPKLTRFFFTCGGAEANDSAIKTARFFWRMKGKPEKTKVIARTFGYHGTTMGSMSATGLTAYWPMFEPRVPGFVHIPSPYPYRYQSPAGVSPGIAAANELEHAILREGSESVAMFLAEPIQGSGGVIIPPDDYFPRIREICDNHQVLLVSDEVITGFGRSGKLFGLRHWGVEPDIMTFAKAITSGYFPFGGMAISEEIGETLDRGSMPWMHSYTYSAHPVGCAIGLAMLDIIQSEDFSRLAAEKGDYLRKRLTDSLGSHVHVGEVRGKGLMCAVEFVKDRGDKSEFPASDRVGSRVLKAALERGLVSRLRGESVFCLAPPIVTPYPLLDRSVEMLADAVREVLG